MPTYDYHCDDCGKTMEVFHSMKETRRKCPKCGSGKFRKLLGAGAGFLFRGSGFYITDYRSSDYLAKAKAESGGSSAPSPAASGDSKPAGDKVASKPAETAKTAKKEKVSS